MPGPHYVLWPHHCLAQPQVRCRAVLLLQAEVCLRTHFTRTPHRSLLFPGMWPLNLYQLQHDSRRPHHHHPPPQLSPLDSHKALARLLQRQVDIPCHRSRDQCLYSSSDLLLQAPFWEQDPCWLRDLRTLGKTLESELVVVAPIQRPRSSIKGTNSQRRRTLHHHCSSSSCPLTTTVAQGPAHRIPATMAITIAATIATATRTASPSRRLAEST